MKVLSFLTVTCNNLSWRSKVYRVGIKNYQSIRGRKLICSYWDTFRWRIAKLSCTRNPRNTTTLVIRFFDANNSNNVVPARRVSVLCSTSTPNWTRRTNYTSARFPDPALLDYHLWGYLKKEVHHESLRTIEDTKEHVMLQLQKTLTHISLVLLNRLQASIDCIG